MNSKASSATNDSNLQEQIGQRKPFANRETEAFLNITRTYAVLTDEAERLMQQYGLTGVLYNVLRILRGAGEPVTCSTISKRMLTRVPDVTRLIDRLCAKELVERHRTEEDRRLVLVTLTTAGRDLLTRMDGPVEALHCHQLGHMAADELQLLNALLVKARAAEG